ncbi:10993_t:CDS:2 [Entrophospora sp. SA101]|nr:8923_t:CDS:2 [Entrophospora sp. SA101]CAJ0761651.1 10993_t:CDS:2 [Entrophospora sp. SA101]CAJ0840550.1 10157_t:CDS:2 [Entrophospora sp. SA101]CAJ0892593.1 8238_t:CDS:2 [Entrophospora sp. SA101]
MGGFKEKEIIDYLEQNNLVSAGKYNLAVSFAVGYPSKEDKEGVREINVYQIYYEREEQGITEKLERGELDLSEALDMKFPLTKLTLGNKPNLTTLECSYNQLTSIDVSKCPNLTELDCFYNKLTSIEFLKQLPHPEKKLTLGNDDPERCKNNIYNRFYGSLEPLRGMTKLPGLCIDGTDVEEGLEYLPTTIEKGDFKHQITQTQQELIATKTNTPDKLKRIQRLESKINHLEIIKDLLKQRNQIIEQVQEEREIHQDSLKAMDNFYQQNPPQEEQRLNNILKVFEKDYLKLNWENQQKDQKVKEEQEKSNN